MSLYSWGENRHQELGLGKDYPHRLAAEPMLVTQLENAGLVQVAGGNGHTLVLNENGEVYAHGRGQEGQLGLGSSVRVQMTASRVKDNGLGDCYVVKVCAGDGCSAAITVQGELYEWGFIHAAVDTDTNNPSNALPGLARETRGMSERLKELLRESTLQYLQGDGTNRGDLDQDKLDAEAGILVVRTRRKMRYSPVKSPFKHRVRDIALGYGHSLIVIEMNATAWAKGYNDRGQLGVGTRINEVDFVPVLGAVQGRPIKAIACGNSHNLVVLGDTGECFAWGSNVLGQLGISEALADQLLPARVKIDEACIKVSAGSYHSIALTESRKLYSFGHAEYGQQAHQSDGQEGGDYGRHFSRHYFMPQVAGDFHPGPGGIILKDVHCGQLFTCALDEMGALLTWGFGAAGNLGHGSKYLGTGAQRVEGLLGHVIEQVSVGHKHVLALTRPEGHPFALQNQPLLANNAVVDAGVESVPPLSGSILGDFDCVVNGKGRRDGVRAHRALLLARCPALIKFFVDKRTVELPVPLEQRVIGAFIEYLYTDVVRSCPPHRLVDLQKLAAPNCLGIPRLVSLCALHRHQRKLRLGYNLESVISEASSNGEVTLLDQVPLSTFPDDMLNMLLTEEGADVALTAATDNLGVSEALLTNDDIPPGHTSFSWFRSPQRDDLPPGHTAFTYGKLPRQRSVFRVHSYMLERYDFFRAMLSGHFREEGLVRAGAVLHLDTVPDEQILQRLLEWVYTGTIPGGISGDDVADVLRVALALQIEDLARHCEIFLYRSLDQESIGNVLAIAEENGLSKLATQCRIALDMAHAN